MPNKYKNKVEYFGETLIDISDTTAEAEDVVEGKKFYDRSGAPQTGSASIPSKTSDLINDSGFITLKDIPVQKETDPTVPAWAKRSTKPKYTAEEVGALPNDTYIPAKTSDLTNDSGFVTSEDIPKKTSELTNDSGFVTEDRVPIATSDLINDSGFVDDPNYIHTDNNYTTEDKEKLAGVESYVDSVIPKKTSDLTNDSGFITGYTETDPTVPTWAKQSTKPSYTAQEVGALPDDTYIPTKTSDLTNDSGFITREDLPSDTGVVSVNGKDGIVVLDADDVGALPDTTVIPTKTSDLTNDSGFITGYTETDPTVPNWAKQPNKPSYTAAEVGALPDNTYIPNKTSDLTNDSGFITGYTETDPTVPSWAKAASKPTYTAAEVGALPDTTAIPTATSDLTNDSGFITSSDIPVISVNNKTGAVSLTASDIGALPSTAGVVKYDEALSLTDNEKSQARANIQAGASNRNLLDNPWFTVNQRQITTPSSPISGYPADRWYGTYSAVTSDGVTIPAQNSLDLLQRLEPSLCAALVGKTVTVSTLEQDGTIASFTCVFPAYGSGEGSNYNMGNGIGCFVQNVSGYQRIRFRISDARTTPFALRAAKLELGSYSTLANDVPPKLREARADCQERFLRVKSSSSAGIVGFGSQTQSDRAYILIPTPVTMELNNSNTMSVTLTGTARLVGNSSGSINVTSVSFISREANGVLIACLGSNIAANVTYNLYLTSGSYIDISGDL